VSKLGLAMTNQQRRPEMSSARSRLIAAAGAVAFIASGIIELLHPEGDPLSSATDYGIEATFAAGLLLTLAGLYGIHQRQERALPAFGVWAFRVAAAGQGLLGIVALATIARGEDALGPLFPLGVAAWAIGTIAYAVATAKTRALPRWVGPLLGAGTVVGIALDPGGAIVVGAMWLALAGTALNEEAALMRPAPAAR
jgi:hypothetical protein